MPTCAPAKDALPAVYKVFGAAIARQDSPALAGMYTADSQVFPPGGDIITGVAAVEQYYDALFKMGVKRCSFETFEISQHGDIAYETGRVALHGDGDAAMGTLKYLVIWKCEDGSWLVHRDILNHDAPAG